MKTRILAIVFLLVATSLPAADLPTVTVEHLYYLQARADRVRKYKPDEMIEYCLAQKIGGASFDSIYSQIFAVRVELAKLIFVGEVDPADSRVTSLNKTSDAYTRLLQEEAVRVQNGIIREGQIAGDTLQTIARAQAAEVMASQHDASVVGLPEAQGKRKHIP